jgi:hypothetical protein
MEFKAQIEWSNWTFGFWWWPGRTGWGIDIGPLELIWKRPRPYVKHHRV